MPTAIASRDPLASRNRIDGPRSRARAHPNPNPNPNPRARARAAGAEPKILFQSYFKSVGPRTYAAQVKQAGNGNHFLVLTEGKRDEKTGEVKKTRLFCFSEDFPAFFRLVKETAEFIKANPVPDKVRQKREKFWAGRAGTQPAPC